jgi:hypothetical protein
MFAYKNGETRRLEIFSTDRKQIKSLAWEEKWGGIAGWLDNHSILIVMSEPESPELPQFDQYPRTILVVDPFTSRIQTLPPNYPDIDQASRMTSWGGSGTTVYDPTLTWVVYPGSMELEDYVGMGYILYGIPEKKKLAQLPSASWNKLPVWSPDGSQFIVMGDDEFYVVSYEGKISKVTHLNPEFHPPESTTINYLVYYYTWSPDKQHVALWLSKFGTDRLTLAVLDTHTGSVTDTCIPAGYNPRDLWGLPYPVWSPDGKSVVVAANYRLQDGSYDVFWSILKNRLLSELPSIYFRLGGWSRHNLSTLIGSTNPDPAVPT